MLRGKALGTRGREEVTESLIRKRKMSCLTAGLSEKPEALVAGVFDRVGIAHEKPRLLAGLEITEYTAELLNRSGTDQSHETLSVLSWPALGSQFGQLEVS